MLFRRNFALVLMMCAFIIKLGEGEAQNGLESQKGSNRQILDDLSAAYKLDEKCHVLDSAEREGLRRRIETLRLDLKISRDSVGRDKEIPNLPCNGEFAKRLFRAAVAVTNSEPVNTKTASRGSGNSARSSVKTAQEKEQKMLVFLWSARDIDTRCHAFTQSDREILDIQITLLLKSQNLTPEHMKEIMGRPAQDKCDDVTTQKLLKVVKDYINAVAASAAPTPSNGDDDAEWQEVQNNWKKNFTNLPAGRLAAFDGCWNGNLNGSAAVLCLANHGDVASFLLGSAGVTNCRFTDGGARKRDDYVMFFAPSQTAQCSDHTQIQHAEGGCKAVDDSNMECLLTVYSKGNKIYSTLAGKGMSGTITMTRGPAVLH